MVLLRAKRSVYTFTVNDSNLIICNLICFGAKRELT